jgi:DNA segregation ATPase FtsK/SpoIIIE-like protein
MTKVQPSLPTIRPLTCYFTGAVRSQMDIRTCFRLGERKDVELVLGLGMLSAEWNAHSLNAPGKFLVSAPEHTTPKRARGYLVTDQAVSDTATQYTDSRPELDETSQRAIGAPSRDGEAAQAPHESGPSVAGLSESRTRDEATAAQDALSLALSMAPDEGPTNATAAPNTPSVPTCSDSPRRR